MTSQNEYLDTVTALIEKRRVRFFALNMTTDLLQAGLPKSQLNRNTGQKMKLTAQNKRFAKCRVQPYMNNSVSSTLTDIISPKTRPVPTVPPPVRVVRRRLTKVPRQSIESDLFFLPSEPCSRSSSTLTRPVSSPDDRPPEPPVDSFLGTTVRGYYFQRVLNCGGAAMVYEVVKDETVFVAKVSLDNDLDPNFVRKTFVTEYELLRSVSHKNIIRAYEIFEHNGKQIIIMEYFPGCNLQEFFARTSIATRKRHIKVISKQILKALKYLHKNDIVHRDIKPANILIDKKYKVKIIDFGGALKLQSDQMVEDRRPTFFTPDFTPPEVHGRDVRSACDLWMTKYDTWSLGVTLFESMMGKMPYTVESDLSIKRESFFVEPNYHIIERLDSKLLSLVKKCLDVQPSTRITAKDALKTKYFRRFF